MWNLLRVLTQTNIKCGSCSKALVFVDDIGLWGVRGDINQFKAALGEKVELRDLGPTTKFLSMNVAAKKGKIVVNQSHYVREIVNEFNLTDGKVRNAPLPTNGNDQTVSSRERVEPDLFWKNFFVVTLDGVG